MSAFPLRHCPLLLALSALLLVGCGNKGPLVKPVVAATATSTELPAVRSRAPDLAE